MKKTIIKNFIFRTTGLEWLIGKIKLISHNRKNYKNFLKHKSQKDDKINSKEGE